MKKMKHETFIEMFRKLQKLFADYGVVWDLEEEEFSRQKLIYLNLYEDDKGDFTTEPPEELEEPEEDFLAAVNYGG